MRRRRSGPFPLWPEQRAHAVLAIALTCAFAFVAATEPARVEADLRDFDAAAPAPPVRAPTAIARVPRRPTEAGVATSRRSSEPTRPDPLLRAAIDALRSRHLRLPLDDLQLADIRNTFNQARSGGERRHNAIDIPAPRGTAILSVDSGRVVKLHTSEAGGISVVATDPNEQFIYFYAHLDGYHANLREGMPLAPGDTLGYVGTTGNAPPSAPHLHFAILRTRNIQRWSRGTPVNPLEVLK